MKMISIITLSMGSGGAERVISLLLSKMEKEYDVKLFLLFNNIHYDIPKNVDVTYLINKKRINGFYKLIYLPLFFFKYLNFLKNNKIKYSISFLTIPNFINGFIKFFLKDVKAIVSERSYPSIEYSSSKLRLKIYKFLIKALYTKADIVFSNSEWINKDLTENFNVKNKFEVIYNPIIMPKNRINMNAAFLRNEDLRIISVGRIYETKNQKLILDALINLRYNNFKLTILGDGVQKSDLENYVIKNRKQDKITFVGNVKNVNYYLLQNHCFILSSNSEGFPNALVEAMAIGLAVISTNCMSGPLEILNNNEHVDIEIGGFYKAKYGILINVNDRIGLESALEYLIKNESTLIKYSKLSMVRANSYKLDNIYGEFKSKLLLN